MIQSIRSNIFRSAALLAFSLAVAACSGASADAPSSGAAPMATTAPTANTASTQVTAATPVAVDDDQHRQCTASSTGSAGVALCASSYSVSQASGSVNITVVRSGSAAAAVSVDYATEDGSAVAGADYTATRGTLRWAENDSTSRTIAVPVSNTAAFSGSRNFGLDLSDPSAGAAVGSPGSADVSITGAASSVEGSVQLSDESYTVAQDAGALKVSVNRIGGASGAISVGYATSNGSALGGKDFSAASGTLSWADGDADPKTFSVPISAATPSADSKSFNVALTSAGSGAMVGTQSSAPVTIVAAQAAPVGSVALGAASYSVAQNAGRVTVSVNRTGGSSGALSVVYSARSGTAVLGKDFIAGSSRLQWADGDTSAKTISFPISNTTPFAGTKAFTVALRWPSSGAAIGNPGTASVVIHGDAAQAVGSVSLSAASESVPQSAGSVTVTAHRTGGSSGAVSVAYSEANGTAVAGKDFTATSGTVKWADGDTAAKNFSIPVSNAVPFAGNKSFTVNLGTVTGGAAMSNPTSAQVSITGTAAAAVGAVQLSASGYTVAQTGGSVSVTVNRTGGSSGAVSVHYAAANGTAVAGTNFTATSGTLQWASGDTSSKSFSVPISNAAPFSGSKAFSVSLTSPTGGAALGTPTTANVTVNGSASVGATAWVFYNGTFNWAGDWSFAASVSYVDTAGKPIEGTYDVIVNSQQWGGWQPFVNGNCQSNVSLCFNTLPYKYLIFSIKPTVANQVMGVGFMSSGDTPDGPVLEDTSSYCSGGRNPAIGQWESCKIPLSAFALTDTTVLKFWITDQTGLSSNHWYVDNVGFTTN